ncbi:MAG: hypothetical protein ACRCZK_01795 [Oscillospiraceae bacterium]
MKPQAVTIVNTGGITIITLILLAILFGTDSKPKFKEYCYNDYTVLVVEKNGSIDTHILDDYCSGYLTTGGD